MCYPTFASPSIFARLLDEEKGGYFGIEPEGNYTITQTYIENTNILETLFKSKENTIRQGLGSLCVNEEECIVFCLDNRGRCEDY